MEQPLLHSEICRWLNVAHIPETVCFNSGINLQSATQAIASLNSIPTLSQYGITHCNTPPKCAPGNLSCSREQLCSLPSWIPPKTWSLGLTLLCTVFSSSTQPTLCSSLGTQSRKPEGKKQSVLCIFPLQVRFHPVFQEVIIHTGFIALSPVITSPLKHTMAFKKCFTVTLSSLRFPHSICINIFFWM